MATEIQRWTPAIGSSLEQKIATAREAIALATSPQAAIKAAKQLIGQWPHTKPADPETYAASLSAVLAQYPLGIVTECVDPRIGLARMREFPPTVNAVVEWCDGRLAFYQALSVHVERPKLSAPVFSDEELRRGKDAMAGMWRAIGQKIDLKELTFERAVELGAKR